MGPRNLSSTAEKMIRDCLDSCAQTYFEGNLGDLILALQRSRQDICLSFSTLLSSRVVNFLVNLVTGIKAVFQYDLDPTGIRALEDEISIHQGCSLNLVVWYEGEVKLPVSRIDDFQAALTTAGNRLIYEGLENGLSIQIDFVRKKQIRSNKGLGVIAASDSIRSKKIWPTGEIHSSSFPEEGKQERDKLLEKLAGIDLKMAPEERILSHAFAIEKIPPSRRGALSYHLMELKVNLIRKMISDQLGYINIARKWFTTEDLAELYKRRIGYGKIGGKAAGMVLAGRILNDVASQEVQNALRIPESYFLGSDLIYLFMSMNGLMHWNEQKYKPEDEIRAQYPQIQQEFLGGDFPPEIRLALGEILEEIGPRPLIVRSSSQLEDNFGTAFAGKYVSLFCPNQASPEENLEELLLAVSRIYASTLNPDALLYRQRRGLQDYDERMAVLIQAVQGESFGDYFLPHAAGVAFSRNLFRWSPEIQRDEGFTRLVWGLGTRAVGRETGDYPRLVALSHPGLQPDDSIEAVKRYSQKAVDLLDLSSNQFQSLPVEEVLTPRYKPLRYLAELDQGGYLAPIRMRVTKDQIPNLTLTFQPLLKRTPFVSLLREMLTSLEEHYHDAVDLEYTLKIDSDPEAESPIQISLLQCRPQPHLVDVHAVKIPPALPEKDLIFSSNFMVPQGYLPRIRQVIYVNPEEYFSLPTREERIKIGRIISKLNAALPEKEFICIGPGRWGSQNTDLGVFVSYADVHRSGALIELSGSEIGTDPDPAVGTHFFQDLMEAVIYPLVIDLDRPGSVLNKEFFSLDSNIIERWVEIEEDIRDCIQVIDVENFRPGSHLEVVMDDRLPRAAGFLVSN